MMFLFIFKEASPNAYQRNKQSTPTPYRISISPAGDMDMRQATALVDCSNPSLNENFGDFLERIKHETLQYILICLRIFMIHAAKLLTIFESAK